jgi:hypothetical protein
MTLRLRPCPVLALAAMLVAAPRPVPAATITVDGNPADWTGPGIVAVADVDESAIGNDFDIKQGFITHDDVRLYLRVDVWGATTLGPGTEYIAYLDTDGDTETPDPSAWGWTGIGPEWAAGFRVLPGTGLVSYLYDVGTDTYPFEAVVSAAYGTTAEMAIRWSDIGVSFGAPLSVVFFLNGGDPAEDDLTLALNYSPEPGAGLLLGAAALAAAARPRRQRSTQALPAASGEVPGDERGRLP